MNLEEGLVERRVDLADQKWAPGANDRGIKWCHSTLEEAIRKSRFEIMWKALFLIEGDVWIILSFLTKYSLVFQELKG